MNTPYFIYLSPPPKEAKKKACALKLKQNIKTNLQISAQARL